VCRKQITQIKPVDKQYIIIFYQKSKWPYFMYFDYYFLVYIYCGNSHKYYFLEGVTMAFPRLQKYFSAATLGAANQ